MFHLTSAGWLLFRANDVRQVGDLLSAVAQRPWVGLVGSWLLPLGVLILPLLLVEAIQRRRGRELLLGVSLPARAAAYAAVIATIVLLGESGGRAFIYFQF